MDSKERERIANEAGKHPWDFEIDMDDLAALLADSAAKERVEALRNRLRDAAFNKTGEEMQDFIADEIDRALGREDG